MTLNVEKDLQLTVGQEMKIVCEAGDYYPLDVDMVWHKQDPAASGQRVGAPLPTVLTNTLLSSHKHNPDKTYAVASFFYLTASLSDSGKQFTCIVSHQSLRVAIRKSFTLKVVGKKVMTLYYHDVTTRWQQLPTGDVKRRSLLYYILFLV